MTVCAIKLCRNYKGRIKNTKHVTYHRIPNNPIIRNRWIDRIQESRGDATWKPTKTTVVCSDHFRSKDMYSVEKTGRHRLTKEAVPSKALFLSSVKSSKSGDSDDIEIAENQDSNGIEIKVFCPKCNLEVSHTAEGIQQDQTKILVAKVYHYFEQEYEEFKTIYGDLDLTPLSKFRQRTALATGVSESTVLEILQEEEGRNAEKRQEPPEERRRKARKRSRHINSLSEEDSLNESIDDGDQPSYDLEPNIDSEIETLVVKIEPPEFYNEQTDYDSISTEVKAEPPDDDVNNTNETLALTEPAGTKRKGRKISRRSDVTSTRQHSQGGSSTAATSSSVRLTAELDETQQSSQGSQNIIIETGHHQDQLNTRQTINVIVNNNKKERQRRYREQNRDKLKQREAERRERLQYSQSIAGPSTSSNTNRIELNNEEIITAQSSSGSEKIQP